jgi:hypothetical protein
MSFFVSALVSLQALRNEYRLDFLVLLYQDKRTMTLVAYIDLLMCTIGFSPQIFEGNYNGIIFIIEHVMGRASGTPRQF